MLDGNRMLHVRHVAIAHVADSPTFKYTLTSSHNVLKCLDTAVISVSVGSSHGYLRQAPAPSVHHVSGACGCEEVFAFDFDRAGQKRVPLGHATWLWLGRGYSGNRRLPRRAHSKQTTLIAMLAATASDLFPTHR